MFLARRRIDVRSRIGASLDSAYVELAPAPLKKKLSLVGVIGVDDSGSVRQILRVAENP